MISTPVAIIILSKFLVQYNFDVVYYPFGGSVHNFLEDFRLPV